MKNQVTDDQIADPNWTSLYKVGGWGALIVGALFMTEMIVYIASSAPSLSDAAGWLMLFQTNRLLGLVDFGLLEFYGLVLFVPIFLALYVALKRAHESYMTVAVILAFVGIAVNFATSKLFALLSLSDLYATATTDALKSQFLAAAQAVLAQSAQGGIGGGIEGCVPLAAAGLIISIVMLPGKTFGKVTAYVGILANGIGLVMYINAAVRPAFGGSPFFVPFFLLSVIWFFLIGQSLLRSGSRILKAKGILTQNGA